MKEERKFLNNEEKIKIENMKNYLKQLETEKYSNRFDSFSEKTEVIEWREIMEWVSSLAKLIENKQYIGIYGVPRAGLLIGTLLSYKTGLPLLLNPVKNCLVVDDDLSTGITLLQYINRYDTAIMYKNPDCKIQPTYLYKTYGETYKTFIWNKED